MRKKMRGKDYFFLPFLDGLEGLLTDLITTITTANAICKAPKKPPRIIIST